MLKEISQQHSDGIHKNRRWFQDPDMALFVWTAEGNLIDRFQLIYLARGNEYTLEWSRKNGLKNFFTETFRYQSAILSRETPADLVTLRDGFDAISEEIDQDIRKFVLDKLATTPLASQDPERVSSSSAITCEFLVLMTLIFSMGIVLITLLTTLR